MTDTAAGRSSPPEAVDSAVAEETCLRAARRYGYLKRPTFDDILRELVPDEAYQSDAQAVRAWHRYKDLALEMLPEVICRVCRARGVERGRQACSTRCRDIMASEADYAAVRCAALTSRVRHQVVEMASAQETPSRIAMSVGLEVARVRDLLHGHAAFGVPVTFREQEQLERGKREGMTVRQIGKALNVSTRITTEYFQKNRRRSA